MSSRLLKVVANSLQLQRNRLYRSQFKLYSSQPEQRHEKLPQISSPIHQHNEIQHHAGFASSWWEKDGILKALHSLNEIRVPFIRDGLIARGAVEAAQINTASVLKDVKILEIGCGGGILTEAMARLGADVTGIDMGDDVIHTARQHLEQSSPELKQRINYQVVPIAVHGNDFKDHYDAIVVSEVIEHIDDKVAFLGDCINALKPGGSVFITTLNKTLPLWLGGILLGEYVLGLAPKGTHHWDKLISPLDLQRILDTLNCQTVLVSGSTYDFWRNTWRWIDSTAMCYALQAVKAESP